MVSKDLRCHVLWAMNLGRFVIILGLQACESGTITNSIKIGLYLRSTIIFSAPAAMARSLRLRVETLDAMFFGP